jgi:hypothetical protein
MRKRRHPSIRCEFDDYADSVMLSETEAGDAVGFSPNTLKAWRLNNPDKAPQWVKVHGSVRYLVGELRKWRDRAIGRTA